MMYHIFVLICHVLNIEHIVDMGVATKGVCNKCRKILLEAYKQNKFGFMY